MTDVLNTHGENFTSETISLCSKVSRMITRKLDAAGRVKLKLSAAPAIPIATPPSQSPVLFHSFQPAQRMVVEVLGDALQTVLELPSQLLSVTPRVASSRRSSLCRAWRSTCARCGAFK